MRANISFPNKSWIEVLSFYCFYFYWRTCRTIASPSLGPSNKKMARSSR